jgi:hypothetical protein
MQKEWAVVAQEASVRTSNKSRERQETRPFTLRVGQNHIYRIGQNRIYAPYMTVYLVISLPNIPYTHRIYMVLANPTYIYIHSVYTVFLAGKSPNIRSYTVHIYGSGQLYVYCSPSVVRDSKDGTERRSR